MRRYVTVAAAVALTFAVATTATAQRSAVTRVPPGGELSPAERERAQIQNRLGWENMRAEEFRAAVKSFQNAVEIDPEYDYAFYGLGRAHMALKEYPAAISALLRCRTIHESQASRTFASGQEAQRYRNDKITEIDEQLRMASTMNQNSAATQDMIRQLQNRKREYQEDIQRGASVTPLQASVPPYVTLALGSAYFRSGQLADAEREYLATIQADSRTGEAHNNLAVVYLMTGRHSDAERSIAAAKKVGFRVNPNLEADIRAKKRPGS
jgi:Tfp pilus assembly protein PilF